MSQMFGSSLMKVALVVAMLMMFMEAPRAASLPAWAPADGSQTPAKKFKASSIRPDAFVSLAHQRQLVQSNSQAGVCGTDYTCDTGAACCPNKAYGCAPTGADCCDSTTYCKAGTKCCADGSGCCATGLTCCPNGCCQYGCCGNGCCTALTGSLKGNDKGGAASAASNNWVLLLSVTCIALLAAAAARQ